MVSVPMMLLIPFDRPYPAGRRVVDVYPDKVACIARCRLCRCIIWGEDARIEPRRDLLEQFSCWPDCARVQPAHPRNPVYPERVLL